MANIFLSYASEDRERVRSLVETLEKEGWHIWWDRDIHAGPRFDQVIEEEIGKASCVVVVWTEASVKSDWVRDEANEGRERQILVPLVLDDVRPPMGFRSAQTANLIGWPERRGEIDTLLSGVRALLGNLSASTPVRAAPRENSIAVLPFTNMSPDPDQEYFSDGIAEEILNDLANSANLTVIGRRSSFQFKGRSEDLRNIGRILGVSHVLEGSVRKADERVRVTAQLIDTSSGVQIWSDRYDGSLEDVFGMQEQVSRSIVAAMALKLLPGKEHRTTERPIDNIQAYDCYLRARHETEFFTKDGFDRAIEHLRAGLEIIGENAVLCAGMGYVYFQYANMGIGPEDYVEKAEEYAKKALDLDPETAQAHLVLGLVFQAFRGDQRLAFHHLNRSLSINPNDPSLLYWLVIAQYAVGKLDASQPLVRQLQQVDPLSPLARWLPAAVEMGLGRFDSAADFGWHQVPQEPHFEFFHAFALTYAGHFDQALTLIRAKARVESDMWLQMMRMLELAMERESRQIQELLAGEISKTLRRDPVFAYFTASFCALADLQDKAMEWISIAVDQGFLNYPLLYQFDPFLAKLRGQPRFESLMKRVKQEWEEFEV